MDELSHGPIDCPVVCDLLARIAVRLCGNCCGGKRVGLVTPGIYSGVEMRIRDAALAVGCSVSTLRSWEKQGLVKPKRSASGQRVYGDIELEVLRRIQYLRKAEHLHPRAIAHIFESESGDRTGTPTVRENDDGISLGRHLRAGRHRANLTLSQVSASTGLSPSFISSVERGVTGLSMATLSRLTLAYGITVSDLMGTPRDRRRLVRENERPELKAAWGGMVIEQLSLAKRVMEVQLLTIKPGVASEGLYEHEGEEFIFMLDGRFEVWIDETEHYVIETGDCLYFPSTLPHRWRVPGDTEVRLIWVETPPSL